MPIPIHDPGGCDLPALASKGAKEPPSVPIRVKIDDYRPKCPKPGRENGQTFSRIQHRQRAVGEECDHQWALIDKKLH